MKSVMRRSVILVVGVACSTTVATAQTCLHGPEASAGARSRVAAAVAYVRDVNAAQARLYRERNTYVPLSEAADVASVPVGFIPRLTFDRWSYAISLKDTLDPCGFALFSDQDGVVYEAAPSRRAPAQASPAPDRPNTDR